MPKNKFNGFYYGVGMKLDEASVDKAGQQLEGRLNQVVDNITQKVATMSEAIAKGSKNIDAKELVKSLAEAQKELNQFQNFDPSKLQKQIDSLNSTVTSLGNNLGDIGAQLKSFTDDISTRLSNIEIKTSKQGKDALKADLKGIIELARGYRDVMSQGVEVDTSALDKYFLKLKQGFKSLQNSQNPMEMFSDKELAHYFVSFTKILQEIGAPVDKLRSEFYALSSVFKSTFEKSGAVGASSVFKDISYQIETVSAKIRKAEADLSRYEASMAKAQSRTKSTGFDITIDGDKNLNFEQKIARIQEYGDIIAELDYGEEWATATKHQIALIQAAEKELQSALKKTGDQELLEKWKNAFGFDLTNKMSSDTISEYVDVAQKSLENLKSLHEKTKAELATYQSDLGKLMAKEAITTSSKKTNKPTHSVQKQKATGVAAEVDVKIKINQEEWRKAINKAITDVEPKVKPFKIRVEATSGKILEEVKKIRDAALVNKGKDGTSDVNAFNKRFDTFYTNLKKRREEIIDELKTNWHPALKDAFAFKFELLGIDKRSLTKDIDTYLISTVDAINDALAQKPIEFHSNIDKLIDEIQSKIENIKIDGNITLGAGNVTVNPSSIGNVPLILGNIQPGNVVQSQPIITPESPKQEPKPTEDKKSKQISKKAQKTGESLEDILDIQFKNGKEIIEHYIGIAKLGKNLSSIREIADKRITADMFNDENLTKWVRGKMYTKDDIGSYAPGKKATPEALDKFLSTMGITEADLAAANTKEETEFLTPLKKYIYTFMQNRQELNSLIQELTDGQNKAGQGIAHGYLNAGDDTTKYLVDEVFDVVKKLYVKDPKTRAQQLVTNAFKNAHIDLSAMSAMKTTEDKWNLLQSQLFNRKNYMLGSGDAAFATDWEDFAKIFSTSGLGANLDKLSALLKIGRQYSTTSNALSAVGKEADLLIKGRTEEIEKRSRRWNNTIGDYEYTEEKVSQVVQQGVRGMLKGLKAVFENKAGNTLLGYNLGKGYIPDDVYQSPNSSYTQIIKALTTATQNSSKILFDRRMKGLEGNTSVGRYDPPTNRVASGQYKFATQHTEKEQITKWISEINKQKAQLQSELGEINKQYAKLVKPEDKDRVVKLVSEIKTKKENLNQYNDKIVAEKNKIDELKKSLASPEAIYEDIVEKLLQAEENLINLKKELASKKKQQKPGTYNKEIEDLQAKISAQETSIKSLTASADVASRSNSEESANRLIAQEEEKIRILNEKLAVKKENQSVKQKQEEINKLKSEQAALVERINVIREESKKVQDIINKSTSQGAIAAMTTDLQAKTNEIDGLLQKTTAYQSQIDSLQAEIDPHNAEKSFLSKEIEFRKKYVGALKESLKKRKKVRTPESISGDIANRTNELNKLQSEHSRVENELSVLETELGKFGSLQDVNAVIQKLQSIEERISKLDAQLVKHKQNLKTADSKKNIYNKTYSQAVNDLPIAQAGRESARANLVSLSNKYTSERTAIVTEALMQKQLGTLSDDDAKKMQENLHNIVELNKQLQNGTLTQEEYVKKVTEAYILMRKASSEEAKATAKSDAEKLAKATLLVKKYEEEEAILKRIIKTQKPKEPVIAQPDNVSNQSASNRTSEPAQSAGVVYGITGVVGSGNVGVGSVVLNAGGSGLATEDTVSKIYALLSTKRSGTDGSQDSRIEAIKRAIATKEAEARVAVEASRQKAAEEKKAAEEVKKKVSVEKKATEEVKKKTSEEKKGVEQVKKKVAEEKKAVAEVKKQSTSIPKAPSKKVARETIQNLFASAHKSYGEIAASNKVFREHGFSATKGVVTQQSKGLMARVDELLRNGFDTHGHMHPRNSMYSATDLASMTNIRAQNKSYDSDVLITPDYIYKLEGLSKVSVDQLTKLHSLFNQFESSHMNATLLNKAKESLVYEFAKSNGISYSKNTYDTAGNLTDITNQEKMLQKESLELLKEFVSVLRNNKHNTAEEYSAWQNQKNTLLERMKKDEMLNSLMLSSTHDKEVERARSGANYDKVRSGTLIQEAIDYDFDLSLFVQQFNDYFDAISRLGEKVQPGSSLSKIQQYVQELGKLDVNSNEYQELLNNIKALSLTVFDKNPNRHLDKRFLPQLANIGLNDKSGEIRKAIMRERLGNTLRDTVTEDYLDIAKTPVEKSIGKDINVFWNSIKDSYTEIKAANRMFREQQFAINKNVVNGVSTGTYGHTTGIRVGMFNAGGHTHSTNELYGSTDIASIAKRVGNNPAYNTDMLVTPDYVYALTGLKNVSQSALEELVTQFQYVENGLVNLKGETFSHSLQSKIKEVLLHNFANQNKVRFSQNHITPDGKLFNVTDKTSLIGQAIVKKIIAAVQNGVTSLNVDQLTYGIEDDVFNNAWLHEKENKQNDKIDKNIWKHGAMLQSAIDKNADLRYFYDDLIELLKYIEMSGHQIPDDSVLGRIKNAVVTSSQSNKENVMNSLRGDLIELFGYNAKGRVDPRLRNDFDAKYHPYQTFGFQEDIGGELDEFAKMTLTELKAELSRLEGLRDEGSVDPRFATAEKQDVIIGLLKNGVSIAGKGANVSSASQKTAGEKKAPERASKGQTIDNARKEVDVATGAASTTVKDTGEIITKTAQKCGAEILNITKTVKNGVESTTASINNDYEVAMKKTNEQIKAKGQRGLFGAPYDPNENIETTEAQAALNKYIETYNKLQELISKFKSLNLSTDASKNEASKLQVDIDIAQKDLDYFEDKLISVAANTEKFLGGKEAFAVMDTGALDQTGMSLKLLAQQSEKAMVAFNGLYNDGTKLLYDVFDPTTSTFKRYSLEVDKATGYVRKMETAQTGLVNAFQNVNKVQRQSADLEGIDGINANSNLVKQYNQARQKLDQAVNDSWTKARDENRLISLDEQKEIYAMSNEVLRLGKRILSTANSFKIFKAEGGQTFEVVKGGAESLESAMRRLASGQALDDKMSIGNIAYNDATKKLSYDLTDLDGNIHKVTMSYVDMFNQVKVTSNNSVAAMDKVSAAIREDMVIIDDAVGAGLIDTRTDKYVEYTNELKAMFDYKEKLEASDDKLTQNDIDNLNMRKAAVKTLGDELVATAKKNAISMGQGSKSVQNEVNKKNTVDVGVSNFSALSNTKQYKSYLTVYQAMIDKQEEFRQKGVLAGESEQNQLARMAKEVENARVKFEQLANASAQFNAKVGESGQVKILPKDFSYGNLEQEMKQFVLSQNDLTQSQKEMIEKTWSFKNAQDGAAYSVRQGKDQMASMSVIFDEGTHRIGQYTVETKKYRTSMEKFMDSLKNKWQELARYLATFGSFYQVLNLLRQGITYVREIDSALTELKKVTDETEKSYDRFLDTAAKTADKVGSTIKEIVSSTADWARLGYSMEEATRLAESTSVLLNVSEFQSIEDATSALTSTLQAFGYTANQSMYVVDVMNEIGNNFAISSDGIATALQDSASSLMAANNSYEEAVALIAAANRVVQDPNSVGAALRTISLRLRGTSVKELEEAGEDTTGAVESTSKLRSKIKSLSGVDILTETGAYKDTYTILLEISKVWDSITDDKNRAALLELMAGKNRSNTLAAILSNTKDLEEAYASAMEAEGSAYEENEKYLDSIQGRIDLFTNAVQTMWSNALDDSLIKGIVDLGTELVKLIDKIGLIPSLLTAIGITKILPSLLKAITHTETFGGVLKTLAFGAQYANNSIGEIIISISKMIAETASGIPAMVKFGYQAQGMTGAMSQLGKGISMAWAAVPVAGKIMLIVAAISAVVAIVDRLTTSAKEAAKAAEEAVTAYENATKTLKDHYDTIEEIKDDYKELADGVDDLGRNISLSTDEYKRYNEITNKIADMFPEMVSGYTDEGNAIIALKGNVEALTEAYEKEAQAARDAIIVKSNDIFDTFKNNTTNAGSLLTGTYDKSEDLKYIEDLLDGELNNFEFTDFGGTAGLSRWFEAAGIEGPSFWDVVLGNDTTEDYMDILRENLPQLQAYYRTLKSELDAEVNPIKSLVNAYLGNNEDYQQLSDEGKKIAQTIISGFDTEFYSSDEFDSWTDIATWIDTNVIQKLQSTGNLKEFNVAFDLQTQFNNGKISVDDYIDKINEFIKLLEQLGFDNEIITTIKGVFKIDDYETQKQSAMEILDAEGDKSAGTLTKDDLDIIDKNKTKWKEELELDGKAEMSWEDLTKKIAEAKEMAWSASEDFEKISENIDSIQDAYSTLSDVVTEYNENGFLTLDNLQALLSLEPEYLACLQMENGQLSINQQALQSMVQARLAEAKATVVQSAMDQLHALAARTEEQAVTDSTNAASNAVNGLGAYASALGTVAQDAIVAAGAVTAFNAAVEGAQNNKFVDQSEIDAIMSSMNTQLQMIDSVSANLKTNFNAITGIDKDDSGTGGSGKGDTALDRIKNKYEGKLSNLENQQTYIENEIEKLEAEDEAVSKSYYEQQISLEEKKIDLLKQERNELQALYKANPTQETADALWEVEHAIQESTLRMVEFRQSIIDLYTAAFDKAIEAYDNKDDFLSDQQNYMDKYRQLMEMNDSPLKVSGYKEQLDAEWAKKNANIAELALLEQIYADAMANGLKEGSEEWVDLQDKIRATEEAILDNNIAIEEYAEAMRQIPVEAFNSVRDMFGYQTDFLTKQQDYIEGYADYLEAIGVDVPREVYDKLIEIERDKRANTLEDLVDARQGLKDIEAQGFTAADEEWQDAYNQITDLEKQIQDCDIAMAQWEKTIRDMDFEKFERFTNRLDDLNSEIEHIKNLLDDEDVAFEDGTWTEEGITSLGLLYQQMKLAEQKSKEYADKIEELNDAYQSGAMSEQEYYERLQELKEGQWGAIESYEDAKDAIVDMEEARIDMIEEGINEEIDAYKELIDLKKEELDAERNLYEFKKNIQKQTKDIASLQRRIASMSGSTDVSTIAERTKLQAQLREAQEGLDDTYYTHAMDAQSKALDDENEAYVNSKEDYLEMLRDTLDDTATIINTKISEFLLNADVGLGELNGISQEHGITLSDSLMQPWINASMVSDTFKQNADINLFSLINEDGVVTIFNTTATEAFDSAFGAGGSAATLFTTTVNDKIGEIKFTVEQAKSPLTANLKYPWEATYSADGPISTFSEKAKVAISNAVDKAKGDAETMKSYLTSPWSSAGKAVNTFADDVEDALDRAIRKAGQYSNTINNLPAPNPPSYPGNGNNGGSGNRNTSGSGLSDGSAIEQAPSSSPAVKQLQQILNQFFSAKLQVDGVYGAATKSAVANMQSWLSITPSGKYDQKTKDAMQKWLNQRNVSSWFRQVGFGIPAAMYAKGTMGTKKDELAITDESWIGEEITLAAGKNGQLQYLKKGSAVLPSDIASNLVEWGKINPDMSAFSNGLQGMNVMTSVLNKPELNLEFGSLLHIDNCSNEVIPEVKKMVTEALDKFSRQLNYSLRRVGAK